MTRTHLALTGLIFALPVACSTEFPTTFRVTTSEGATIPPETTIVMGIADVDDVAAIEPLVEVSALGDDGRAEAETFSSSPFSNTYLFAFADLNGDGEWSEGEPWGADPNNPVYGGIDEYTSNIELAAN